MAFSSTQNEQLNAPLTRDNVKQREQGGRKVSYVEGWHVIAEANRIFGFDGWSSETLDVVCVSAREREIGQSKRPGWGVTYIAKVRIEICVAPPLVTRDGYGSGHGIDVDLGLAHESAIKEAETDARKRALMTFGNPFGLALYDKQQTNVVDEAEMSRVRFIDECKTKIASFPDNSTVALAWWQSDDEKKKRRDFELNNSEVEPLKALVIAKLPADRRPP